MKKQTLQELRIANGMTQEFVAYKLKVTKTYISLLENGERNPSDDLKEKFAKLYGVTIEQIFLAIKATKCYKKRGGTKDEKQTINN